MGKKRACWVRLNFGALASPWQPGLGCVQMALFYVLVGLGFMGLIGSVVWPLAFSGVSLYLPNGGQARNQSKRVRLFQMGKKLGINIVLKSEIFILPLRRFSERRKRSKLSVTSSEIEKKSEIPFSPSSIWRCS